LPDWPPVRTKCGWATPVSGSCGASTTADACWGGCRRPARRARRRS
jgi:hypothetical protein